jgi:hypothetical protein
MSLIPDDISRIKLSPLSRKRSSPSPIGDRFLVLDLRPAAGAANAWAMTVRRSRRDSV